MSRSQAYSFSCPMGVPCLFDCATSPCPLTQSQMRANLSLANPKVCPACSQRPFLLTQLYLLVPHPVPCVCRIPLSLASKVSSRIAARGLRTFLAPRGAQNRAAEQSPFTRSNLR